VADEAFRKAVELLARRSHFERELRRKLEARGFDEASCVATLDRLRELGYVDDRSTARELIASKLRRGPLGRRRLLADLLRRGAEAEVAEEALDDVLPGGERDRARAAAESWLARGRGDRRALARHLERKGFSGGDILRTVEELDLDDPSR